MSGTPVTEPKTVAPERTGWSVRETVRIIVLVPLWGCAGFASAGRIAWHSGRTGSAEFGSGVGAVALLVRRPQVRTGVDAPAAGGVPLA